MNTIEKAGSYFFILGALLAIFSGAFPVPEEMQSLKLILLITTGAFVGLLNVEEEKESHFLVAIAAFIIASNALNNYLENLILLSNLGDMLTNLIIFAASAGVVLGLKLIFTYGSSKQSKIPDKEELIFLDPVKESAWNTTIFVAVCAAFIIFILEAFFYTNGLSPIFEYLSYLVILVFIIDAIILYSRSKNFWKFLRFHWADVLAIIPFSGIFQLAKLFRLIKLARIFTRTSKLARVSKISHSAKFFSHHSGFNKYMRKK